MGRVVDAEPLSSRVDEKKGRDEASGATIAENVYCPRIDC